MNAITFEPDETSESEDEGYEPEPLVLAIDDVVIFDKFEFESHFECYAAMNKGGQLFVLPKGSHTWVSVESFGKPPKPDRPAGIKSVK